MTRAVVTVATTPHFQRGMKRLREQFTAAGEFVDAWNCLPPGSPAHADIPYGFKAFALREAAGAGYDLLLWCDSCIVPIAPLEPLWERIERDGYCIVDNGWSNETWCCDSWYADCFPGVPLEEARAQNRDVKHVVATCFGLNMRHPIGAQIFAEFYRYASETKAFCGPNHNAAHFPNERLDQRNCGCYVCGPQEVMGHRYDQSCLSIIAHRLGVKLALPPSIFAYRGGETAETILCADGNYAGY